MAKGIKRLTKEAASQLRGLSTNITYYGEGMVDEGKKLKNIFSNLPELQKERKEQYGEPIEKIQKALANINADIETIKKAMEQTADGIDDFADNGKRFLGLTLTIKRRPL